MPIVRESWKSTSFNVCPELRRAFDGFLARKGLTYTKLINGFMLALLNGDIAVDDVPYGEQRIMPGMFDSVWEMIDVTMRDKNGNVLNPTKTFEED